MRQIAGEKPGSEVSYTPEAFGNREDSEPVRVSYTVPSERERRKMVSAGDTIEVKPNPDDPDGKPIIVTKADQHVDRQAHALESCVLRVEGYQGRGGPILTGTDLAEHGETEIVSEVYNEIMGNHDLTEDEAKKPEGSSDSLDPVTLPSGVTAPTAENEGSTSSAIATE